jgi:hypothetical protein
MTYIAVVRWEPDGLINKYQEYVIEQDADDHVERVAPIFPQAFAASVPDGRVEHWVADPVAKTVTNDLVRVAASNADTVMRDWKEQISSFDSVMPRPVEETIASMDAAQYARLSQHTRDSYEAKIVVRAAKP